MNVSKNILGGFFKMPSLKDVTSKIRGKLGYLPRDEVNEDLNEISGYAGRYPFDPLTDPPKILPRVYPCVRGGL